MAQEAPHQSRHPINGIAHQTISARQGRLHRLKNWRRIATRYDRLAENYLAAIALVSVVIAWV